MLNTDSTNPRHLTRQAPALSAHAVERWEQRVEPRSDYRRARLALDQFVTRGRRRPTPRHWTTARAEPGLVFVYWAELPHVCALVREETVVTVLTRDLCRRSSATPLLADPSHFDYADLGQAA